ncbi:MAG: 50S ribosomal protein L21 [Patescibacteria group bacterium]
MKIAVIKTGGKQYLVKEKDKIKVEKIRTAVGAEADLDVLLLADGDNLQLGNPFLEQKAKVKIVGEGRTKKVTGVKYKPKTRQAKKFGHRQRLTEVEIVKI